MEQLVIMDADAISTHILTKRMTLAEVKAAVDEFISTHILTKRMTAFNYIDCDFTVFQLTSSRRG